MAKITLSIEDSLHEALTRAMTEGEFETQRAFYNLLLTKGYYSYLSDSSSSDGEVVEKPRLSRDAFLRQLSAAYQHNEEPFVEYTASFIIYRYREGEVKYLEGIGMTDGATAEILLNGWKLNFRLKTLYLYYIFPERTIQGMTLDFLGDSDSRHPLFTVLKAIDKITLLPEEEQRVKFLLQNYEKWSAVAFEGDDDDR